ncbi:MBL fold metallo-hydrolase [Cytobacillus dafuensis]|uniref:MBL fold metallo-hydrolase n=1 Tax=Cytobacillus dafuensis TaxID=1742359 RepID=A0A5B8Z0P7_CYTDA|nr:MBL fold metallo-hydrolase [Cytobacillus dafuensis]QED46287.1 MBL fold metallo-hydrolase [Cytobacillus dafuensis]
MSEEFLSKHFRLEKVREGIYAAIAKEGGGAVANAGFVDLGDKTIVLDTFNTQQAAKDLKDIAEKITNRPVTWVINSHWHGDHIRGNQTFKDCHIISSQNTYDKMKEVHPSRINNQKNDIDGLRNYIQSLKEQIDHSNNTNLENQISFLGELEVSLPTLELVLPQQTFKEEIALHGTNRSAKLFTLGGGHSCCDAILYIPEDKVIFMGDLLFVDCHPTIFEDSNPDKWIQILKKVESMEIEIAVPGHGSVGTKKNLSEVITYINDLSALARDSNSNEEIKLPNIYKHWSSPKIYQQNYKTIKAFYNS